MRSILLFALLSNKVAASYNATTDSNNITCVYPISGQYDALNRVLFYALWVVVFLGKKWTWPSVAAIVYVMAYAATAAVHALLLVTLTKNKLYDLDAVGTWAVLSVTNILAAPLAWYSDSIRNSVYRPVYGFWCTVVAIGAICSAVAIMQDYQQEAACYSVPDQSSSRTLLTTPTQLLSAGLFNCTYQCFQTSQPMRQPKDIAVIPAYRAFGDLLTFELATVILTSSFGVYWSIWGFCLITDRKRTRAELIKTKNRKISQNAPPKARRNAASAKRRAAKELQTGKYQQIHNFCLFLNPIILPVVLVLNEIYILKKQALPSSDPYFVVGQWGPWVTVGLSIVAAAINARYGHSWQELQTILAKDREAFELAKLAKARPKLNLDLEKGFGQSSQCWSLSALEEGLKHLPPPEPVAETVVNSSRIASHGNEGERLRLRTRLPLAYQPPFPVDDLALMPIIQQDQVCSAYQEWESGTDGIIIRDVHGHDWLVQKGILWHRELWEQAEIQSE